MSAPQEGAVLEQLVVLWYGHKLEGIVDRFLGIRFTSRYTLGGYLRRLSRGKWRRMSANGELDSTHASWENANINVVVSGRGLNVKSKSAAYYGRSLERWRTQISSVLMTCCLWEKTSTSIDHFIETRREVCKYSGTAHSRFLNRYFTSAIGTPQTKRQQ